MTEVTVPEATRLVLSQCTMQFLGGISGDDLKKKKSYFYFDPVDLLIFKWLSSGLICCYQDGAFRKNRKTRFDCQQHKKL